MKINIFKKELLPDNVQRLFLSIQQNELVYFGFIIEAFEGFCSYTTVKDVKMTDAYEDRVPMSFIANNHTIVQLDVSPDFVSGIEEVLNYLSGWNPEIAEE